jgi:hypothetical protein
MAIPSYTKGYPPDGSTLGQTKATMRNNLDGTFETLNVDHVNNNGQPGTQPAGYHTIIHEVTQINVSTVANYNHVFSGVPGTLVVNTVTTPAIPPNGDTQLYSLSGTGILSQLTGSVANPNGYQWIGAVLLQWGVVDNPGSGTVIFSTANVKFPNNCFNVSLTTRFDILAGVPITLVGAPTDTSFSYASDGNTPTALYWSAIGN